MTRPDLPCQLRSYGSARPGNENFFALKPLLACGRLDLHRLTCQEVLKLDGLDPIQMQVPINDVVDGRDCTHW